MHSQTIVLENRIPSRCRKPIAPFLLNPFRESGANDLLRGFAGAETWYFGMLGEEFQHLLFLGCHLLGFKLPDGMNFRTLFLAAVIAALGLTVALFVAGAAFTDPGIQGAAKMGALFSAGVAPLALILAKVLKIKRVN